MRLIAAGQPWQAGEACRKAAEATRASNPAAAWQHVRTGFDLLTEGKAPVSAVELLKANEPLFDLKTLQVAV